MFDFLGNKIQRSLSNISKKNTINEDDIIKVARDIKMSLLEADVNLKVVKEFVSKIKEKALEQDLINKLNPYQHVVKIVKDELVKILGSETKHIKIDKKPYVIMFCGLQGGGKTTSVAKIASYFRKNKLAEKILIVAADIYRPAAVDQLKKLAKEINIDCFEKGTDIDVEIITKEAMQKAYEEKYDLVLVDTAGRLSIDEKLMNELENVKKIINPNKILFVADAMSGQDIINVASTFHEKLKLSGTILTKLDSDARGGAALSIRFLLNIPIYFIGTGEKINNIDLFHPTRMADRILGMGDVLSLIEQAEGVVDKDKSKKLFNKMMRGEFDLDDLLENLRQVKKMGKISRILKMLPKSIKIDETKLDGAQGKLELYEILISSMTSEERKNPKLLKNASRKQRILKGSGRDAREYNKLISEFESMSKKMKEMAKGGKGIKGFDPSMFGL